VSCCELEFQFVSFPTNSRLPSRSKRSAFYNPNPPSPWDTTGVIKKHVSAYCEAIIRFTNISYRRLRTTRAKGTLLLVSYCKPNDGLTVG